jgi:hypothetical protein
VITTRGSCCLRSPPPRTHSRTTPLKQRAPAPLPPPLLSIPPYPASPPPLEFLDYTVTASKADLRNLHKRLLLQAHGLPVPPLPLQLSPGAVQVWSAPQTPTHRKDRMPAPPPHESEHACLLVVCGLLAHFGGQCPVPNPPFQGSSSPTYHVLCLACCLRRRLPLCCVTWLAVCHCAVMLASPVPPIQSFLDLVLSDVVLRCTPPVVALLSVGAKATVAAPQSSGSGLFSCCSSGAAANAAPPSAAPTPAPVTESGPPLLAVGGSFRLRTGQGGFGLGSGAGAGAGAGGAGAASGVVDTPHADAGSLGSPVHGVPAPIVPPSLVILQPQILIRAMRAGVWCAPPCQLNSRVLRAAFSFRCTYSLIATRLPSMSPSPSLFFTPSLSPSLFFTPTLPLFLSAAHLSIPTAWVYMRFAPG